MITLEALNEWREKADWQMDSFVEMDLVLSRVLIELYSEPVIAENFALIGGTAIHKLYIQPGARYSEDIDISRLRPGNPRQIFELMREKLDPWLGKPDFIVKKDGFRFVYSFDSYKNPPTEMRLKIESKWVEGFEEMDLPRIPFNVESSWFNGEAAITTLPVNDIFGGKLCALYERKKGRDLFDLWCAIDRNMGDPSEIVESFERWRSTGRNAGRRPVYRSMFENNLREKMKEREFRAEMESLLGRGEEWDIDEGMRVVMEHLIRGVKESRKQMKKRREYRFEFPDLDDGDKKYPPKPSPPDRGESR